MAVDHDFWWCHSQFSSFNKLSIASQFTLILASKRQIAESSDIVFKVSKYTQGTEIVIRSFVSSHVSHHLDVFVANLLASHVHHVFVGEPNMCGCHVAVIVQATSRVVEGVVVHIQTWPSPEKVILGSYVQESEFLNLKCIYGYVCQYTALVDQYLFSVSIFTHTSWDHEFVLCQYHWKCTAQGEIALFNETESVELLNFISQSELFQTTSNLEPGLFVQIQTLPQLR
jgi:hypothetical protein